MSAICAKILIMGIVQLLVAYLVLGLVLFIAAGTLSWFYGWIFLILFYSFGIVLFMWVLGHNHGLVEERTGFKSNQPTWDKAYTILLGIPFSIWWISMPLDGSISLVTDADVAPPRGSDCPPVIILPHVPRLSRESLSVVSGTHPGRPGANGSIDAALSIRPPSPVHQRAPLLSRICFSAGIMDRSTPRDPPRGLYLRDGQCGRNRCYRKDSKAMTPIWLR